MLLDNIYTSYQQCFYRCQRYKVIEGGISQGLTYTHYIYKINNKDLVYSTGSSAQYSVITYMGKGPEK